MDQSMVIQGLDGHAGPLRVVQYQPWVMHGSVYGHAESVEGKVGSGGSHAGSVKDHAGSVKVI